MIVRMTRSLPCLCLLYLVLPTPAAAQDAPASAEAAKVVRVVRVASPPVIDGRLAPSIDDVLALAHPVLRHRMALNFAARAEGVTMAHIIDTLAQRIG